MVREKGHYDVCRTDRAARQSGLTTKRASSRGSAESQEILDEMDALRRQTGPWVVAVLVLSVVVVAKPLLENVEIDIEVPQIGCFSREMNRTYAVGEKWATGPPYMCASIECTGPESFSALPCPTFLAPDYCTEEPGDQTAVYPACCPWARCPEEGQELNTPKPTDLTFDVSEASNYIP